MHKSIQNTLSRRNVLTGAVVIPVATTPTITAGKPEGVSKRIGELFRDWQHKWLVFGEACEGVKTKEDDDFANECCDAANAAWRKLNIEPATTLQDIAAKAHAVRIQWDGCELTQSDLEPIWRDIGRLAALTSGGTS